MKKSPNRTASGSVATQLFLFPAAKKASLVTGSLVTSAILVLSVPDKADAASGTWTGGGATSAWNDASNWNAIPGALNATTNTETATFNSAPAGKMSVTIDAGRTIRGLLFSAGAGSYTIGTTNGNALHLTSSATLQGILLEAGVTSAQVIDAPLVLRSVNGTNGGTFYIQNSATSAAATLAINGNISVGGVTTGTSTLFLAGAAPSTSLNVVSGNISDGDGILKLDKGNDLIWILSGSNSYSGGTTLSKGELRITNRHALGTGLVSMGSATTLTNTSGSRLVLENAFSLNGDSGSVFTGDYTINGNVALEKTSSANISVSANSSVIMAGVISGTHATRGFTKAGAGTLTLTGSNTFGGGVMLSAGALNINHSSALGTGKLTVSGASTVGNTSGGAITITNAVELQSKNPSFNLDHDLIFNGATYLNSADTTRIFITSGSGTVVLNANLTTNLPGVKLAKFNDGGLTLGGSNSFTGGFDFYAGTLNINNAHALGSGTLTFLSGTNKTLDNTSGSAIAIANTVSIGVDFTFKGTNDLDLGTNVTINNNTITVLDKTLTMNGFNSSTSRIVTKDGAGTLSLSTATVISGTALVRGGALRLGAAEALRGGIGATGGNQHLQLNGGVVEMTAASGDFKRALGTGASNVNILAGGGGFSAYGQDMAVNLGGSVTPETVTWGATGWSDSAKLMLSHSGATHMVDFQNAINLRSAAGDATERVIEVANGSGKVDARISGVIANGVGTASLKKTGAGTLELTANNTYSGLTTVSAGTLLVNGSLSSTLGVHVESGATLGGRGTVAKVSGAGTLSVGNSAGIFTTGQLDTSEGMDFRFELTAATVGGISLPNFADASNSGNDVLRLTGATPFTQALDLNNTITIDLSGTSAVYGDIFVGGFFATADFFESIENATFVFLGLSGDLYLKVSTIEQEANFAGGSASGYITQFEVVPEPSSTLFVLMGSAAGWLAFSRKRKMSKAA